MIIGEGVMRISIMQVIILVIVGMVLYGVKKEEIREIGEKVKR